MALEKIDIETLSRKGITEEKLSEELTMLRSTSGTSIWQPEAVC